MLIDLKNLCSKLQVSVRGVKYVFLGLVLFNAYDAFAGDACIPFSYSSVDLIISPTTISATPNNTGADILLSQSSTQARKSTNIAECTTSSSAYLTLKVIECTNSCGYQNSSFTRISGSGNSVDIFFISVETPTIRTMLYDTAPVSSNPIFKIVQQVKVTCSGGGLSVVRDPVGGVGYRVSGINGSACNGAYTVTHTVSIYQTQFTPPLGTPTNTFVLGSDINLSIALFDGINASDISYRTGYISDSGRVKLNFVSSKCTVTAPSNVTLRDHDAYSLWMDSTGAYSLSRSANFNLTLTGCNRTSFNTVSFFWVFSDVDSGNDSILLNSNTGNTNNADNVGVQFIYLAPSSAQTTVRHRTPLPIELADLPAISSGTGTINFKAKMVKSSNVTRYSDIRSGAFSATATLFVQYQ